MWCARAACRPLLPTVVATAAAAAVLIAAQGLGFLLATAAALAAYAGLLFAFRTVTGEDVLLVAEWVREAAAGWSRE